MRPEIKPLGNVPCVKVRVKGSWNRFYIVSTVRPGHTYGYKRNGDIICVHPDDARIRADIFEPMEPLPDYVPPAPAPVSQVEEILAGGATIEEIIELMSRGASTLTTPDDLPPDEPAPLSRLTIDADTVAALAALLGEQGIEPIEVTEKPAAPVAAPLVTPTKRKVRRAST